MVTGIAEMLKRFKAIEFGDFTLASGVKSSFYVDVKSAVTHPELLAEIATEVIKNHEFDVIAGVAIAAVCWAAAARFFEADPSVADDMPANIRQHSGGAAGAPSVAQA